MRDDRVRGGVVPSRHYSVVRVYVPEPVHVRQGARSVVGECDGHHDVDTIIHNAVLRLNPKVSLVSGPCCSASEIPTDVDFTGRVTEVACNVLASVEVRVGCTVDLDAPSLERRTWREEVTVE